MLGLDLGVVGSVGRDRAQEVSVVRIAVRVGDQVAVGVDQRHLRRQCACGRQRRGQLHHVADAAGAQQVRVRVAAGGVHDCPGHRRDQVPLSMRQRNDIGSADAVVGIAPVALLLDAAGEFDVHLVAAGGAVAVAVAVAVHLDEVGSADGDGVMADERAGIGAALAVAGQPTAAGTVQAGVGIQAAALVAVHAHRDDVAGQGREAPPVRVAGRLDASDPTAQGQAAARRILRQGQHCCCRLCIVRLKFRIPVACCGQSHPYGILVIRISGSILQPDVDLLKYITRYGQRFEQREIQSRAIGR